MQIYVYLYAQNSFDVCRSVLNHCYWSNICGTNNIALHVKGKLTIKFFSWAMNLSDKELDNFFPYKYLIIFMLSSIILYTNLSFMFKYVENTLKNSDLDQWRSLGVFFPVPMESHTFVSIAR